MRTPQAGDIYKNITAPIIEFLLIMFKHADNEYEVVRSTSMTSYKTCFEPTTYYMYVGSVLDHKLSVHANRSPMYAFDDVPCTVKFAQECLKFKKEKDNMNLEQRVTALEQCINKLGIKKQHTVFTYTTPDKDSLFVEPSHKYENKITFSIYDAHQQNYLNVEIPTSEIKSLIEYLEVLKND